MRTMLALAAATSILAGSAGALAQTAPRIVIPQRTLITTPMFRPATMTSTAPSTTSQRSVAPAPAPGRLACAADENGIAAPASVQLRSGGNVVASGSCASPIEVPAGTYDAIVTLESALDRPTRALRVTVQPGALATARASFQTAILEVRFTADRSPVPGLAIIQRDGVTVGTLGSGVSARLSAGTYTIVARYRTGERTYVVTLAPEQRRAVRADF